MVQLPLIFETFGNMVIVILCDPVYDVTNLPQNLP